MLFLTKDEFMEDFANAKVKEALEAKKAFEAKKVSGAKTEEEKTEEEKSEEILDSWMSRCIQKDNMSVREIKKYVLMYRDLANEDVNGKISVRRMKQFFNELKKNYPDEASKVELHYDMENGLSTKRKFKLNNAVQAFWNKCRTVENAYKYCHEFHFMANRIAKKLDAPEDMGVIERCKWLRLWVYVIKDQSFFWNDIKENGYVDQKASEIFDKTVYLNPEIMVILEEFNFSNVPDGTILLDMIKAFINLYPEEVQRNVLRFGELDGINQADDLRAGYVRQNLKKKLFPVMWVSGLSYFFTKPGIQTSKIDFMANAVKAYKNKKLEELPVFEKESTDAYDHFKTKVFNCYEISTEITDKYVDGQQIQYVFAVTNKQELEMYAEVYKWLLAHPDFKFGADGEEKTLTEYGMLDLLKDSESILRERISKWALNMGLASNEEDVNLDCIMQIIEPEKELYEEMFDSYIKKRIEGKDIFEKIGFSSDFQAKACLSKTAKLIMTEAVNMAAALKRVKTFGTNSAIKSDIVYLEIFKYMMSNKKEELPKNTVKLYGQAFL